MTEPETGSSRRSKQEPVFKSGEVTKLLFISNTVESELVGGGQEGRMNKQ